MNCSDETAHSIRGQIRNCLTLLSKYQWLHDSLVHDFFVDNHWSSLPLSWRIVLAEMSQEELANFLSGQSNSGVLMPLELLCLRAAVSRLSLTRRPVKGIQDVFEQAKIVGKGGSIKGNQMYDQWRSYQEELSQAGGQHKNLHNLFRRHVKPKKQHEIARMASLCSAVCLASGVNNVVDVGSGVGHLSRLLAFGHGLKVTSVDAQSNYIATAERFDHQLHASANKKEKVLEENARPDHLAAYVDFNDKDCLDKVVASDQDFGVVGLHPCGDLGSSLVDFFSKSDRAKVLAFVGCCHHKLTSTFPMSSYIRDCSDLASKAKGLTYLSRELSCHAIETYTARLKTPQVEKLKVHCHRALLEMLIAKSSRPDLKHSSLQKVPQSHLRPFAEYAVKATERLMLDLNLEENQDLIEDLSGQWWNVVTFYSLRLVLAPVIETVVLLDRVLSLQERGFGAALIPIFDPELSPRNHVLLAVKEKI